MVYAESPSNSTGAENCFRLPGILLDAAGILPQIGSVKAALSLQKTQYNKEMLCTQSRGSEL